jgi:hypothetical protein
MNGKKLGSGVTLETSRLLSDLDTGKKCSSSAAD